MLRIDPYNFFIQQVFLKASVDLSALTDLIIAQSNHIGSTIKVLCNLTFRSFLLPMNITVCWGVQINK